MSKRYLVTGVAGTGKTTLEKIFAEMGYETNDIDQGFAHWYDRGTMEIVSYDPNGGREWLDRFTYRLDLPLLKKRLKDKIGTPLIMFGDTGDLYDHFSLFDRVFLLEYPNDELVRHRLLTRGGDHPYGKHPDELAEVLSYYKHFQEKYRAKGAIVIDCSQQLEEIVEKIKNDINQY